MDFLQTILEHFFYALTMTIMIIIMIGVVGMLFTAVA